MKYTAKTNHSFNTFLMFILIHKQFIEEIKYTRILIWKRSWSTTSYIVATFHPTIGQCAHQSLSITTTSELGMIPQGTREITGSHIAQNQNIHSQANTQLGFTECPSKPIRNWVLQAAKATSPQHMGTLDLSSQARHTANTQSTHLIKHSHTQPNIL